ncbi:MAG: protein kinase family protein, partial [Planctomycetota bacterium]
MSVSTRTYWPSMSDYQEAVQSPKVCFADKELKNGSPVLTALGLPRPICGAFASVYELEKGNGRWAVKCFLRNIPDQHERYAQIASHLGSCGLPYFVTFDYQADAILVQGKRFPLVKMEWVHGSALNEYIVANLGKPDALRDLEARWLTLLEDLKSKDIAHGDLQHGNELVHDDGNLRLIDYDGMFVPALNGQESHETGHADYQSPLRSAKDFHGEIDTFSGIVIRVAIRALTSEPELWKQYDNGENLLFRRQDYCDPKNSPVFAALQALGDPEIDEGLDVLRAECAGSAPGPSARDQRRAEKKQRADEKRRLEEQRRAEDQRRAEEKQRAKEKREEEQRLAEEKRLAKEKRRAEHNQRMAEEKRRADEKRRAKQAKA